MVNRPMQKRNKKIVGKTQSTMRDLGKEALNIFNASALKNRIESKIEHDVNQADLAQWRNDGWQVVHYQFVSNLHGSASLAVVMEREVDNPIPQPLPQSVREGEQNDPIPTEDKGSIPTPNPSPLRKEGKQEIVSPVFQKLIADNPIFAAICEDGIEAVKEVLDDQVLEKAYEAMSVMPVDIPITRFESRLLAPPSVPTPSPSPSHGEGNRTGQAQSLQGESISPDNGCAVAHPYSEVIL